MLDMSRNFFYDTETAYRKSTSKTEKERQYKKTEKKKNQRLVLKITQKNKCPDKWLENAAANRPPRNYKI